MLNAKGEKLHFESLPEWTNLPNLGQRTNALMRENWQLINMAADICNQDVLTAADEETLSDIWAQTVEIEREYAAIREYEWAEKWSAAWGIRPGGQEAA